MNIAINSPQSELVLLIIFEKRNDLNHLLKTRKSLSRDMKTFANNIN